MSTTNKNKRKFFPGDEWLYYKFYIGKHYSNKFLLEGVYEVGELLVKNKIIDKWFFIRYSDPDDHIRFRVHLIDKSNLQVAVSAIGEMSSSFTRGNKLVSKIQIDTYNQEIERYGLNEISVSEELFYLSSLITSQFIKTSTTEIELILLSIYFLITLFEKIGLTKDDLLIFLNRMTKSYKSEFSINRKSENNIKIKFQELESSFHFLESIQIEPESKGIIDRYCDLFSATLGYNKGKSWSSSMIDFTSSHIHMCVNRLFFERQREYEMLIYDFLVRLHLTKPNTV